MVLDSNYFWLLVQCYLDLLKRICAADSKSKSISKYLIIIVRVIKPSEVNNNFSAPQKEIIML